MSIREALIIWVDIQIFQKDYSLLEEIWEALSSSNISTLISEETIKDLQEIRNKGPPFPPNLFSKVREEIFKAIHTQDCSLFIENCSLASIYSKRRWNAGMSLPDEAFEELINECDVLSWKLKMDSDDIKIYKKDVISTICVREECIINASIELIPDLIFLKRQEYEKGIISMDVLEKINDDTFICRMILKSALPLVKKRDIVFLHCTKKTTSGVLILITSCDHKNAPETDEYLRIKSKLSGYILTSMSSNYTRYVGLSQLVNDKSKYLENRIQGKIVRSRAHARSKSLKEYAEKLHAQNKK